MEFDSIPIYIAKHVASDCFSRLVMKLRLRPHCVCLVSIAPMSDTSTASTALILQLSDMIRCRKLQDASYAAMAAKIPLIITRSSTTANHPAFAAVVAVDIIPLLSVQWGKATIVNINLRHRLRKSAIFFRVPNQLSWRATSSLAYACSSSIFTDSPVKQSRMHFIEVAPLGSN